VTDVRYVDTGICGDHNYRFGLEGAFQSGPVSLQPNISAPS